MSMLSNGGPAESRFHARFYKYITRFEASILDEEANSHREIIEAYVRDKALPPNSTDIPNLPTTFAEMEDFHDPMSDSKRMYYWVENIRKSLGIKYVVDPAKEAQNVHWGEDRKLFEGSGFKIPEAKDETLFIRYEECKALLEKETSLGLQYAEIQAPPPWHKVFHELFEFGILIEEVMRYQIDDNRTFELFWSWSEVFDEEMDRLREAKVRNGGRNLL
ncbi:MAG: hypothetical protein Q9220_001875 [cf. Caloplaca sp. 1 TL-2023]